MTCQELKKGETKYEFSYCDPKTVVWDMAKNLMQVTRGFFIANRLVSQDSFRHVMGFNPTVDRAPNSKFEPVTDLSWHEAISFVWRLNFIEADDSKKTFKFLIATRAQLLAFHETTQVQEGFSDWCLDAAGDLRPGEMEQDQVAFPAAGTAWIFNPKFPLDHDYRPTIYKSPELGFRIVCVEGEEE